MVVLCSAVGIPLKVIIQSQRLKGNLLLSGSQETLHGEEKGIRQSQCIKSSLVKQVTPLCSWQLTVGTCEACTPELASHLLSPVGPCYRCLCSSLIPLYIWLSPMHKPVLG